MKQYLVRDPVVGKRITKSGAYFYTFPPVDTCVDALTTRQCSLVHCSAVKYCEVQYSPYNNAKQCRTVECVAK